ncbi:unnamed protein product, partial [Strongylus vulgaris]
MTTVVLDPRSIIEALSCLQQGINPEDITHPSVASQVFEKTCSEYDDARKAIEDGQEQIRRAEMRKAALRSEQDARKRKENAVWDGCFQI